MGVRILVWVSMIFLLGGMALITYLALYSNNYYGDNKTESAIIKVRYATKADGGYAYSIKQLDSLTAADNYKFTKANANTRPFSGI